MIAQEEKTSKERLKWLQATHPEYNLTYNREYQDGIFIVDAFITVNKKDYCNSAMMSVNDPDYGRWALQYAVTASINRAIAMIPGANFTFDSQTTIEVAKASQKVKHITPKFEDDTPQWFGFSERDIDNLKDSTDEINKMIKEAPMGGLKFFYPFTEIEFKRVTIHLKLKYLKAIIADYSYPEGKKLAKFILDNAEENYVFLEAKDYLKPNDNPFNFEIPLEQSERNFEWANSIVSTMLINRGWRVPKRLLEENKGEYADFMQFLLKADMTEIHESLKRIHAENKK